MALTTPAEEQPYDLFIVGGGINGCGIARDGSDRGLCVCLAEMGDLADHLGGGKLLPATRVETQYIASLRAL